MIALVLEQFNHPFVQKEVKRPVPGPGQVLVKIRASGVNPLDLKIKAGHAAHARTNVPAILGIDMAGVVEEVGEDVTGFAPGDEVYGMTGGVGNVQGSLAEYAAVDAALLAPKPRNLTFREAAAIPLSFITAWEGLMDRAHTGVGKTVLVHGGSGGVGHIAVQLAVAAGATVYATDRGHKASLIESYGATPIDFTQRTVDEYVKEHTDGDGFDIVFDSVGGGVLDDSFRAAKIYHGHVLSILGWGTHSLAPLSFRGATYSGVFTLIPLLSGNGRVHHGGILREATTIIEAGKLMPLMDPRHFTMVTVEDAYAALESRTGKGKIVLDIGVS
jgi:NADPH:quinone reductase-like Zn-dependent oxidoreductase